MAAIPSTRIFAAAGHFAKQGYRLRPLLRTILNSKTYQLSSKGPKQSPRAARESRYFTQARRNLAHALAPRQPATAANLSV